MNSRSYWTAERIAGTMLLLGDIIVLPGLVMFWIRGGVEGRLPPSTAYYAWERGLILSAVVPTAIGFVLLAGTLNSTRISLVAKIGAIVFMIGAVLLVAGEALGLSLGYEKVVTLINVYVVLACLSETLIGIALSISGILVHWIGWATIGINVLGITSLLLFLRDDIYFPILHHLAPLLIGIGLMSTKSRTMQNTSSSVSDLQHVPGGSNDCLR